MGKHYVYIVRCRDGTFYAGYAVDLAKRVAQHNAGKGAKYTRGRRPVVLVYWEEFSSRSEAQRREKALQKRDRAEKARLVAAFAQTRAGE
ncbi:MAG: GIY-YIG nuclease family protein [Syntrophothermus sp.]